MSTISFLEMKQECAAMLKMDLGDSAQLGMISRWLNFAQDDINSRSSWPWLESREIVQTVVEKNTGTVSVVTNGTTITGSGTSFSATDVGSYIQFQGANDWYKITAVASAISLTIEVGYAGTSDLTGGTYTIRKVFYSLSSNVDKVLDCRQSITPIKLTTFNWRIMDTYKPDITSTGTPEVCYMFGQDSSRNWTFCLYPIPDAAINLEFRTKIKSTDLVNDSDITTIPEKWAKTVMIAGAIWRGMEYNRINREDVRADKWLQIYESGIQRMMADENVSEDYHGVVQSVESRVRGIEIRYPETYDISK